EGEQSRVLRQVQDVTRVVQDAVSRELEAPERVLSALSASPSIDSKDWGAFQQQAEKAAAENGVQIALRTPDRQQLVNTVVPFGSRPLPVTSDPILWAADERAIQTKRPAVSDLYFGAAAKQFFVAVVAPIMRNDEVAYLLTMAIPPDRFLGPSRLGKLAEEGWLAAIVGRDGRVIARSRNPERFVGVKASEPLLMAMRQSPAGQVRSTTLDGDLVQTNYVRNASDWTIVISVPERVLNAPVGTMLMIIGFVFALVIVTTGVGAWAYGRLLGRELRLLSANAALMGDQHALVSFKPYVAEVAATNRAMFAANTRIELLVAELDHRVKNTLAIIQSVAARSVANPRERTVIEGRIAALSRAHEALSTTRWEGADLRDLLIAVAATYDVTVSCTGPKIILAPKAVVSLAQVFHELLSNAREHGAFRHDEGAVSVAWEVEDGRLQLEWVEEGWKNGQHHFVPGFGLKIVALCIRRQLGGEYAVDDGPEGWKLSLHFPLESELGLAARRVDAN
ncbi:MAG: signal transduction histidine kinase, partial [Hyphomicrobiales bacterium]|nr:signal transduction histidine kinase [Hyphomicrobiales bacterium]